MGKLKERKCEGEGTETLNDHGVLGGWINYLC